MLPVLDVSCFDVTGLGCFLLAGVVTARYCLYGYAHPQASQIVETQLLASWAVVNFRM